jgi:hypothetical protein
MANLSRIWFQGSVALGALTMLVAACSSSSSSSRARCCPLPQQLATCILD